jgi:hypothetical protein
MSNYAQREHPVMLYASWAALLGSFVLSAATWIIIGDVAGFNIVVGTWTLYFALGLPLVVDAYIVCALVAWVHPTSARVERFAKWNAYGSAAIGWLAQAVYHGASVWAATQTEWKALLAFVVGGLPPAAAFLGVHLRAMSRRDLMSTSTATTDTAPSPPLEAPPQERPTTTPPLSQAESSRQLSQSPSPIAPKSSPNGSASTAKSVRLPIAPIVASTPSVVQDRQSSPAPMSSPRKFDDELERLLIEGRLAEYRRRTGCSLRTAQRHAKTLRNGHGVPA